MGSQDVEGWVVVWGEVGWRELAGGGNCGKMDGLTPTMDIKILQLFHRH
jgi:hypothetical protein